MHLKVHSNADPLEENALLCLIFLSQLICTQCFIYLLAVASA